ncbi:MAG: hypothetical protein ACK46X_08510 [Candidatus Sericytochromatia bacterium]
MTVRWSLPTLGLALALGCATPAPSIPAPSGPPLIASLPSPSPSVAAPAVPSGAFLFFEDFERPARFAERWDVTGGTPEVNWRVLEANTCGGAYTMLLGRAGQAPFEGVAAEATLVLRQPIDLIKARRPHLKFDVLGQAQPARAITVQAEGRRADGAWEPLGEPVIASDSLVRPVVTDVTRFAGGALALRFRAVLTPGEAPLKGLLLDDVQIIEPDTP